MQGRPCGIKFLVHQDGFGDDTAMYVDDVSLPSGCGGASATPTATGTPSATPTAQREDPGRGRRPLQWGSITTAGSWIAMAPLPMRVGVTPSRLAITPTVWQVDPVTNAWTPLAPVPDLINAEASRCMHPSEQFFVFGGDSPNSGTVVNTTRIYDIGTNTWSSGAPMPDVRAFMASAISMARSTLSEDITQAMSIRPLDRYGSMTR